MKYFLIILFAFTLNAQDGITRHFVDMYATGENDGSSWTDAWNDLNNINWHSTITSGDTIYISGGEDSTTYYPKIDAAIYLTDNNHNDGDSSAYPTWHEYASQVVMCPSWEDGHNGEVWFTTRHATQDYLLNSFGLKNVKIYGVTITDRYFAPAYFPTAGSWIRNSGMVFENCHFINAGMGINGEDNVIRNCILENPRNDYDEEQDLIGNNGGRGGMTIENNLIIYRNGSTETTAHRDMIQMSNFGRLELAPEHLATVIIRNNLIIDQREDGDGWNSGIYSSGAWTAADFYIYNNIVVSRKNATDLSLLWLGTGNANEWITYDLVWKSSLHIYHNTLIMKGTGGSTMFTHYNPDSLFIKNNLVVIDTPNTGASAGVYNLDGGDGYPIVYKEIDYNYFAIYGGTTPTLFGKDNGLNKTFANWQDDFGYDLNSIIGNSLTTTFADKYDTNKVSYYTETGRDVGVNLYSIPYLRTDALGKERPETGAWDIGALQYQTGAVDSIPTFSLTPVTGAEINTEYIAISPITGVDTVSHFWTTTSASFKINYNGTYNTAMKTADPDNGADTVYVKNTTGGSYSTLYTETIVGGGNSQNFNVTTKAEPEPPAPSNGGWIHAINGRKIFDKNGKVIITR